MLVGTHTSPTVIFTADFPGVYVFTFKPSENGPESATFLVNGVWRHSAGGGTPGFESSFSAFLAASDELSHNGNAGELHGFRIGDEF